MDNENDFLVCMLVLSIMSTKTIFAADDVDDFGGGDVDYNNDDNDDDVDDFVVVVASVVRT